MGENQAESTRSLDKELETSLDSVDEAEQLALKFAGEAGFSEEDLHKIGMAVREAMVNAVVHGNRYNANKKVYLSLEHEANRFAITITDEGAGFERTALADPLAEENLLRQSGRGLLLIQAFVDEFEVTQAPPRGSQVKLVKYRT